MTDLSTDGLVLASEYSSDQVTATTLPVMSCAGTHRTMLRVQVPVAAGDVLDIRAIARVTNDCGYTVGISSNLWQYDLDNGLGSAGLWTQIGDSTGDNVEPARHHMPVDIMWLYRVPADWPAGHRMVVSLRCDAASTAYRAGDTVTVDPLGQIIVARWTAPAVPAS